MVPAAVRTHFPKRVNARQMFREDFAPEAPADPDARGIGARKDKRGHVADARVGHHPDVLEAVHHSRRGDLLVLFVLQVGILPKNGGRLPRFFRPPIEPCQKMGELQIARGLQPEAK